jgi:hypothetical protein
MDKKGLLLLILSIYGPDLLHTYLHYFAGRETNASNSLQSFHEQGWCWTVNLGYLDASFSSSPAAAKPPVPYRPIIK